MHKHDVSQLHDDLRRQQESVRKQKLPRKVRPQLATLVKKPPQGNDWLQEIKFDGYRLLARLQNGEVHMLTRNNEDCAEDFAPIAEAVGRLPVSAALLDGEVVALQDGISDFSRLQEALSAGNTEIMVYQIFDLLYLDGYDLKSVPQVERKRLLWRLLTSAGQDDNDGAIRYTEHIQGRGTAFHDQACRRGLEGIISKRASSAYSGGRNRHWCKIKCSRDDDFVVVGFTDPRGARIGFGSLLLGTYDNNAKLVYSGRVGTGFKQQQLRDLHARLRRLERVTAPISGSIPDVHSTHWVKPELVVEVRFSEYTQDGRLRHPAFRGLREDKNVADLRPSGDT